MSPAETIGVRVADDATTSIYIGAAACADAVVIENSEALAIMATKRRDLIFSFFS